LDRALLSGKPGQRHEAGFTPEIPFVVSLWFDKLTMIGVHIPFVVCLSKIRSW